MAQLRILNDPTVRSALKQAWGDSQPGTTVGQEEGGFIVMKVSEVEDTREILDYA